MLEYAPGMGRRGGYKRFCSLARGLDVVGERWSLVIIQELLHRPLRYAELRSKLPGIGSNVLGDRLRRFEQHHIVERVPGGVGQGVAYSLTSRGRDLGPALAMFRRWALDELLPMDAKDEAVAYDLSYAVAADAGLAEEYEWRIDELSYALRIDGSTLTVTPGSATEPVVTLRTTREFMYRWVEGATTWDRGRTDQEVGVDVPDENAWQRMQLATGYPGRQTA
jgi:DNA-binding HxlR family transcriptional regulator